MKSLRSRSKGAAAVVTCTRCQRRLARENFRVSNLRSFKYVCFSCIRVSNRVNYEEKKNLLLEVQAREMSAARPASPEDVKRLITRAFISKVIGMWGRKCFLTGLRGALTVIRATPDAPLSYYNAVPVNRLTNGERHALNEPYRSRYVELLRCKLGGAPAPACPLGPRPPLASSRRPADDEEEIRTERQIFAALRSVGAVR